MFDKGQKQSSTLSCDSSYLFVVVGPAENVDNPSLNKVLCINRSCGLVKGSQHKCFSDFLTEHAF